MKMASTKSKRVSWEPRLKLIQETYPSVVRLNWRSAFDKDLDLFTDIMRDVLKADAAMPGRSGPKPAVDYRQGVARFRQLVNEDYSVLPFAEAFTVLARGLSLTVLARKVDLSRSETYRLLRGEKLPTLSDLEAVAKGFKKSPAYFSDYRAAVVAAALHEKLLASPDTSIRWFGTLSGAKSA